MLLFGINGGGAIWHVVLTRQARFPGLTCLRGGVLNSTYVAYSGSKRNNLTMETATAIFEVQQ